MGGHFPAHMAKKTAPARTSSPNATPSGLILGLEAFKFLHASIWPAALVACVYLGVTVPARETAGLTTTLTVAYRIIGDLRLDVLVSYVAAGTFGILWRKERRTRIEAVAREHRRVEELERRLDPNRTSSGFEE